MAEKIDIKSIGPEISIIMPHRVYYAETDRMGYVYYGNYASWFEKGRTELLRKLGMSYKEIEDSGILLPVRCMNVRYFLPVKYDEEVSIITYISLVKRMRVIFESKVYDQKDVIRTSGTVELACVTKEGRPTSIPDKISEMLKKNLSA
jgi:acyl-CoA thioester hydrolase